LGCCCTPQDFRNQASQRPWKKYISGIIIKAAFFDSSL